MPTIQPRPEKNSATFSLMHVSWQHTNGARNQKRNAQPHLAHPEGMSRGHAVLLKKSNDSIPRILTFHQSRLTSSMTRLRARHNQHLWRHARQHYTHKPPGSSIKWHCTGRADSLPIPCSNGHPQHPHAFLKAKDEAYQS